MGNRRDRKKAMKRELKHTRGNPFGTIPGVPSFQGGGEVTNPFLDFINTPAEQRLTTATGGITQNQPPPGPGGIDRQALIAAGWREIAPGLWLTEQGRVVSEADLLNPPSPAAPSGFGAAAPQFRPGELELLQAQLELDQLNSEHARAIADGNLQLARQIEARIDAAQRRQLQLEGVLGAGQGLSGIGSSLGGIQAQRQQFLSQLAANPRDFAQLNIGLGGGESIFNQLIGGQQVGGQSTSLIGGTPTLGRDFAELLRQVNQRPELPIFEEAAERFRSIPGFAKGGQRLVTDEPMVAIGQISGQPRFTVGEGGKPELLQVIPLQEGGTVQTGFQTKPVLPGGTQLPPLLPPIGGPHPPPPRTDVPVPRNIADLIGAIGRGGFAGAQPAPVAAPPLPKAQPIPTFPGIQALIALMGGLPQQNAQAQFGQEGSNILDVFRAGQEQQTFINELPRTAGEAIRRLSAFTPQSFFGILPSQQQLLASVFSALGVPPEDVFASIQRSFPTGPNPSSISFGNFEHGGMIAYMPRVA